MNSFRSIGDTENHALPHFKKKLYLKKKKKKWFMYKSQLQPCDSTRNGVIPQATTPQTHVFKPVGRQSTLWSSFLPMPHPHHHISYTLPFHFPEPPSNQTWLQFLWRQCLLDHLHLFNFHQPRIWLRVGWKIGQLILVALNGICLRLLSNCGWFLFSPLWPFLLVHF